MKAATPTPDEDRREPVRTGLAAAAGLCAIMLVTYGGSAAVGWWQHRQGVGVSAQGAAGIAVSEDTSIAVTAPGTGTGGGVDLVWRLGERPDVVGRFAGGAPVTFVPGRHDVVVAATPGGADADSAGAGGAAAWSLADPSRPVRIATLPGPGPVRGIAYAPDRTTLAIAYPTVVRLWNMADPTAPSPIASLPITAERPNPWAHPDYEDQVVFSPDGHLLAVNASGPAAAPVGPAISLWDVTDPERPALLASLHEEASMAALEFSPVGPRLAGLARDGTVTVYDLTDPSRPTVAGHLADPHAAHIDWAAYALTYTPDGGRLAAVVLTNGDLAGNRSICVWDVNAPPPAATACRTDRVEGSGAITFTTDRGAIVGPDLGGADTLTVWPTAIGAG